MMNKTNQLPADTAYFNERNKIETYLLRNELKLSLAEAFYRKHQNDPFSNYALGRAYVESGERYQALPYLERAVDLSSYEPPYVEALSAVHLALRNYQPAIAMLQMALEISPSSARVMYQLGLHCSHIGRTGPGIECFRKACEWTTDDSLRDAAKQHLVHILMSSNRSGEAEQILDELAVRPGQEVYVATNRAQIGTHNLQSTLATELFALAKADNSKISDQERAKALLTYGNLAEKSGDYDLAFKSWKESRTLFAPRYDADEIEKENESIRQIFCKEQFEKTRMFAHQSAAYIFVVGMPRSGTTLMESILGFHPKCKGVGELGRMEQHNKYFLKTFGGPNSPELLLQEAIKGKNRDRSTEALRLAEFVVGSHSEYYVDKTPTQFMAAGCIHMCLPRAKFINCIRHPADTFISTYQNDFVESYTYVFEQSSFAHYYLQREKLIDYWRSLFGHQILDVRYEEMVSDPERQVRRILDFLGLEWDPTIMNFYTSDRTVNTFSRNQVRNPINAKSVGRWRNYEKHLGPLFEALEKAGYSYPGSERQDG